MLTTNLGMYIEKIMQRTNEYWIQQEWGFIEKRQVPFQIIKKMNISIVVAKLLSKSKVDYFGFYKNQYFEIECKQTSKMYFTNQLFLPHQICYMEKCLQWGIKTFLLVYFEKPDEIILVEFQKLKKYFIDQNCKKIDFLIFKKMGVKLSIIFPGIVNLKDYL